MSSLVSGYYWTFKRGSVGKELTGQLRDATGPFAITGTLTFTAKSESGVIAINAASCTPDPDQVTNKGNFKFTLNSTTAIIAADTYNIEFKHTVGGVISIWPDDANAAKVYGKLKVTETL